VGGREGGGGRSGLQDCCLVAFRLRGECTRTTLLAVNQESPKGAWDPSAVGCLEGGSVEGCAHTRVTMRCAPCVGGCGM
jgi:hypothetical protein